MEYSKRPIDIPEQISILTSRGLVIDSESFARQQFSNISYFRLASYWNTLKNMTVRQCLLYGKPWKWLLSEHCPNYFAT